MRGVTGSIKSCACFFFSSRRRHTRFDCDWSSDVCSSDLFIGVDGTNTTLNSGRMQINLKPLEERGTGAVDVIHRLQPELARVQGITLFLQSVQDLTIEDRVSRTQFQLSLESPDAGDLAVW